MVPIPADVQAVFDSYDPGIAGELLRLRDLILLTAAETPGVGALTETLKWGQPAYLTSATQSGSTVRLAPSAADADSDYGVYFICHTGLVDDFRSMFGDALTFDGNRAITFTVGEQVPTPELRECIAMALTYHRR